MKRILITAMLSIAAVGSALAADLPQPMPAPQAPVAYVPTVAPVYNWGGIYLGINGGYAFGNSKWSGGGLNTGDFSTSGGLVGGTLGANFQTDAFVFGLEADRRLDWHYRQRFQRLSDGRSPGILPDLKRLARDGARSGWIRGRSGSFLRHRGRRLR